MHVIRLARITALAAVIITVIGLLVASHANAMPAYVRTFRGNGEGLRVNQTFDCVPDTYPFIDNPIDWVQNKCPTRVWLHEHENGSGLAFCVSPYSFVYFGDPWQAGNLQVSENTAHC